MASKLAVVVKEEGRGKGTRRTFATLAALQAYVMGQWQGVDYIDSAIRFHSDYCTFELYGCTLQDLGNRRGARDTDMYWDWEWKQLGAEV